MYDFTISTFTKPDFTKLKPHYKPHTNFFNRYDIYFVTDPKLIHLDGMNVSLLFLLLIFFAIVLPFFFPVDNTSLAYGTHLSKPIITKVGMDSNKTLSISGFTDYYGPTSSVVLYVFIKGESNETIGLGSIVSDRKGEFSFQLKLPNQTSAGDNYTIEIMSQCRKEHQSFCTNRSASVSVNVSGIPGVTESNNGESNLKNLTSEILKGINLKTPNCENLNPNISLYKEKLFFTGTENNDVIVGTPKDDTISGLEGNDIICSKSGNDTIYGGVGIDRIYGGTGNDSIDGGHGNDLLLGGEGQDSIDGGHGNDLLLGGEGQDSIKENNGMNFCYQAERVSSCYN